MKGLRVKWVRFRLGFKGFRVRSMGFKFKVQQVGHWKYGPLVWARNLSEGVLGAPKGASKPC